MVEEEEDYMMLWKSISVWDLSEAADHAYCNNHASINQAQELQHLQCRPGN